MFASVGWKKVGWEEGGGKGREKDVESSDFRPGGVDD